jgi:mRNA-degrading endonuclease RelE of RelBE toxin-antitoxin system
MRIVQTPSFGRAIKRLHKGEKKSLDKAVSAVASDSKIGEEKVGDLAGVFSYKFKSNNVQWLLAYRVVGKEKIKLLVVGPHENFYRDLKRGM